MFRKIALLLSVLIMPLAATAGVPPEVNLHNGYIIVVNHIHYVGEQSPRFAVKLNVDGGVLEKGGSVILNKCCIVAGLSYLVKSIVEPAYGSIYKDVYVHPRLCNIRGIPFGFAVVELTGESDNHKILRNIALSRVDVDCPSA